MKYLLSICIVITVFAQTQAQDDLTTADSKTLTFEEKTKTEKWLEENNVPLLGLGYIENGVLVEEIVYGKTHNGIAAPSNTMFNVASLTKPVTATIAFKLMDQGKWSLDEPLSQYWVDPDIADDPRTRFLTTRLVLSHQTGFPNWRWNNPDEKLAFEFYPGTKYQYSGEGMEYLRRALESKFEKSIDQLADELIFDAIGVEKMTYIWTPTLDEELLARPYNTEGEIYDIPNRTSALASDDLLTSVGDYCNFLIALSNGELVSDSLFNIMSTPQVFTKENKYFGLGFEIYDFGSGSIGLAHGGSDQGVQALAIIFPKAEKGLVIFSNVDDGYKVFEPVVSHYLGDLGRKIIEIETK